MKRSISILIILTLLVSLFAGVTGCSEPSEEPSPAADFEYSEHGGAIHITKYIGQSEKVVIPGEIDGLPVTIVLLGSTESKDLIRYLSLPSSVTYLAGLSNQTALEKVKLCEGLDRIGEKTFSGCTSLTEINLPESLTKIDASAFEGCVSLRSVKIPSLSEDGLGDSCFSGSGLESVELADGLTRIPQMCFYETNLQSVKIPSSVRSVGSYAFAGCKKLSALTIPEGPESVGTSAFSDNLLIEISIPASVRYIDESAFWRCENLQKVIFKGDAPEEFVSKGPIVSLAYTSYVVYFNKGAKGFTTPVWNGLPSVENGGNPAFGDNGDFLYYENDKGEITLIRYKGDKTDVVVPDKIDGKKVGVVGTRAFIDNDYITSVTLPDSVSVIEPSAFSSCEALKTAVLPSGVTEIGETLFFACKSLTGVNLDNIAVIDNSAFAHDSSLTELRVPSSVKRIEGAFYSCGLQSVTFDEGIEVIGDMAFSQNDFYELDIPASVRTIGQDAFSSCSNLWKVTLHEGLESVGDGAFQGTDLREITIPASVTRLDKGAFRRCAYLEAIYFEGDAPDFITEYDFTPGFTVYIREGATGFTGEAWEGIQIEYRP